MIILDLFIECPILLTKDKKVDYDETITLLKSFNSIYGILLFSKSLEGLTFSLNEREEIFINLRKIIDKKIIYEANSTLLEEETSLIKKIKPDFVMIPLYDDNKLSSRSFEKHLNIIMKKIKTPTIIHIEDSFAKCKISYISLINLLRINKYFYGILDDSKDAYFANKINYIDSLKIFKSFSNYINQKKEAKIDCLITDLYSVCKKEIEEYLYEKELGFINPVLISYLKLIEDCISYYPRGMAIKYLLNKQGYSSCYSKSPYYFLENEEKNKLDFIF